jgi:hypothetical protein
MAVNKRTRTLRNPTDAKMRITPSSSKSGSAKAEKLKKSNGIKKCCFFIFWRLPLKKPFIV